MNLYEVTMWNNNQPPVLVGYYKAETEREAKVQAYYAMDKVGIFCVPDSLGLRAEVATKTTPYERWKRS
jgi:hypothetical protein